MEQEQQQFLKNTGKDKEKYPKGIENALSNASKDIAHSIKRFDYKQSLEEIDEIYHDLRLTTFHKIFGSDEICKYSNKLRRLKLQIGECLQEVNTKKRRLLVDKLKLLSEVVEDIAYYCDVKKKR